MDGLLRERRHLLGMDFIRIHVLSIEQGVADAMRLGGDQEERLLAKAADLLAALVAHQVGGPASLMANLAVG
jgi:hypothetical protein